MPILVEVNIAGEETKFGTTAEDAMLLVEEISKLENVRIRGLMTIAPFVENPEDNRLYFRKIKQLSVDITNKNIDNVSMEILSMGMTNDYTVALKKVLPWSGLEPGSLEQETTVKNKLGEETWEF